MIRDVAVFDPKRDLVSAKPEKLLRALIRRTPLFPGRVEPSVGIRQIKKWLIGVILAALVAVPKETLAFQDGNDLLDWATSGDSSLESYFGAYVIGVRDALESFWDYTHFDPQLKFCTFDISTNGDVADAVRIWMRRNPEKLDMFRLFVVVSALQAHFPCDGGADDEGQ